VGLAINLFLKERLWGKLRLEIKRAIQASLLIAMMVLVYSMPMVYADPGSSSYLTVDRRIEFTNGGLTIITDRYNIQNNGSTPIQDFTIYLEKAFFSKLDQLTAFSNTVNLDTSIQSINTTINEIRVAFSQAVNPGGSYSFNVVYVFSGLIVESSTAGTYTTFVYLYPKLPSAAASCNLTLIFPETTSTTSLDNPNSTYTGTHVDSKIAYTKLKLPLEPLANETSTLMFKALIMQMFYVNSLSRTLIFDPFGNIVVSDSYNVKYLGTASLSTISIYLMRGRTSVTADDGIGDLRIISTFGNATVSYATLTFRYSLSRNVNASFTVHYVVPAGEYIKSGESAESYRFEFDLSPSLNWTARQLSAKILLPEGGEYVASFSLVTPQIEKNFLQTTVDYAAPKVTRLFNSSLILDYRYNVLWSAFRPTLWAGMIIGFIGAIVLLARRKKEKPTAAEAEEEVHLDRLREFVTLYEDKKALSSELEEDEEAERRKVLRKEDRKRMKIVEVQLAALNKKLGDLRGQIRVILPRYSEPLKKIEVAESDLSAAKDNLRTVEIQLRSGKISREVHDKLYRNYEKRVDGAKTAIDAVIIRLKEEIDEQ
jgi:hypothetical protein